MARWIQDSHNHRNNFNKAQQESKVDKDPEKSRVVRRSSRSISTYWTSRSRWDLGSSYRIPTHFFWSREYFNAITLVPNTVKFSIYKIPPRRVQPDLPTGTQGEDEIKPRNGVPPPIVGRLDAGEEAGLHQQFCKPRSITLLGVLPKCYVAIVDYDTLIQIFTGRVRRTKSFS